MFSFPAIAVLFGHVAGAIYIFMGEPLIAIYFGLFALTYMLMLLKTE